MGPNLTLCLQKEYTNVGRDGRDRCYAEKKILAETNTFFLRPKLTP